MSASKRIVVLILVAATTGRPRRFVASICACSRETILSPIRQTPVSNNSSVSSGASSGSTQALADFFDFTSIRFPHADNSARRATRGPNNNDDLIVKSPESDVARLTVIPARIDHRHRYAVKNLTCSPKIEPPISQVFSRLRASKVILIKFIVVTNNQNCQRCLRHSGSASARKGFSRVESCSGGKTIEHPRCPRGGCRVAMAGMTILSVEVFSNAF